MSKRVIAITTGDIDGIGLEVTLKALLKLQKFQGISFKVFVPSKIDKSLRSIYQKFELRSKTGDFEIIKSIEDPAIWVEQAAQECFLKNWHGLVTAPLSKEGIIASGLKDLGHTEILKRIARTEKINMAFVGKHFNLVLATAHTPLSKVAGQIDKELLLQTVYAAQNFKSKLTKPISRLPIAILGLNPHSGENGLIGNEEFRIIKPALAIMKKKGISVVGPLVPDAAFLKDNWGKYSMFVSLYHDQGLIPFKMIHGQNDGIQISLGLPFWRTSVDHGTAKDLFGKNCAKYGSMSSAIKWAIKLTRR